MEKPRRGPLASQLGGTLRQLRKQRRLSLAQLAQRLDALGCPLHLNTLNKIELGSRGVDLDEVVALARALRVPPLALAFPLGRCPGVEVLPGQQVGTWEAAKWFSGETPFPNTDSWDTDWEDSTTRAFRLHDDLLGQWIAARNGALSARMRAAMDQDEAVRRDAELEATLQESRRADAEGRLRRCRKRMRDSGMEPDALPDDLAHVDAEGDSPG